MNTHYKKTFIALALVFAGACAFLFNIFYTEARNTAIAKLHEEQMIHAKQADRGIEDFFATWTRSLSSLSKMDEIVDNNNAGQRYLKLFYEANQEQILSITRVDERGVILYNFPVSSLVGTDIPDQKHVREMLQDHKPVISDVFKAIEGSDAVALHVPVFRGSEFKIELGQTICTQIEALWRNPKYRRHVDAAARHTNYFPLLHTNLKTTLSCADEMWASLPLRPAPGWEKGKGKRGVGTRGRPPKDDALNLAIFEFIIGVVEPGSLRYAPPSGAPNPGYG